MENPQDKKSKWTRTPALIKAQKKYYNKIREERPEYYKELCKKHAKIAYSRNKQKEGYMEKNRKMVSEYYYKNKERISAKRKIYYQENRERILASKKEKREQNKKNINNNNDLDN